MSAVIQSPDLDLRVMTVSDLSQVMEIECAAYDFPWSEGIFRDCMRVGYVCWVAEQQGFVQAYGVMSVAVNECHVLNLCVRPREQGQGLGRRVLRELLSFAHQNLADTAFLEVRPSNGKAIALYLSEGFNEMGSRKDYYPANRGREDALIFAKTLSLENDGS